MPATVASLYDRAAIIPGRSMTRSKAPDRLIKAWADFGDGAVLTDTNGQRYIDMVCGLGAISLGYGHETQSGWWHGVYSLPHAREVEAAEVVLEHVAPWASSVRFLKTGSEATHAAYRIAKQATGRPHVLVGDWAYHGWHEWCSPSAYLYRHGHDLNGFGSESTIAAVFVEPHRWEPDWQTWLQDVRAFCDRIGALLVFDSMIYGGRWALGGTSQYFGVTPDLECFGKAFGNGEAVAFVVGNQALAEHGELVSGTFSGCVTGLSAVCDVLHTYTTEPVIETIWDRGRQLQAGLLSVVPKGLAVVEGVPPLQRIRFLNEAHRAPFRDAMAASGVLWHPDVAMTMYAHTQEQINQVIAAAEASCQTLNS